ncbi:MAG: hypothetical protein FXF54_14350 [Kosmotoga sp.]|nr:MAG: hypothetical protein FXF54_14350 [Kosmotoga sp.]
MRRRHRKTTPEPILRRGMLLSFLHNDGSRLKEEDKEIVKEYLKTNKNLQNLYLAVNDFRDILKSKDDSRLENWWIL